MCYTEETINTGHRQPATQNKLDAFPGMVYRSPLLPHIGEAVQNKTNELRN